MSLDGLATAIYRNKDGQHVVSTTVLSSTSEHEIYIERTMQTPVDPFSTHTNARAALMTVLDAIVSHRVQIVDIGRENMIVPLPIVHGIAQFHPTNEYAHMIKKDFPEYFVQSRELRNSTDVNFLLKHLFTAHLQRNGRRFINDVVPPQIALHDYVLFLPNDPQYKNGYTVSEEDHTLGSKLQCYRNRSAAGGALAKDELVKQAQKDALQSANDFKEKGTFESTRFIQWGLHTDAFKNAPRYTYLEDADLKEVFIGKFITQLRERHNICLKTPNDDASPAFADITATFLADVWMLIHYKRTGEILPFKNVIAKRR